MSTNANPQITPEQAVTIFRDLAAHRDLRFLNLQEHAAVQQAVTVLDNLVNTKPNLAVVE